MAFYCLPMLKIALELARIDKAWDDLATKFFEHFLAIAKAMNDFGSDGVELWDEEDGFFYDVLVHPDGRTEPLRVRSMVGLLPILPRDRGRGLGARRGARLHRAGALAGEAPARADGRAADQHRRRRRRKCCCRWSTTTGCERILPRMFDPAEFLSPYGIRSLSAATGSRTRPTVDGRELSIDYEPGESRTGLFGGNSNWRGPVWFPVNVLLADTLRTYAGYLPDSHGRGADRQRTTRSPSSRPPT